MFAEEFPNYFGEMISKNQNGMIETRGAEQKIEHALMSILKRLQLPYVSPQGKLTTEGFFESVKAKAQRTSEGDRIEWLISGEGAAIFG